MMSSTLLILLGGYLIGSIPSGYLAGKIFKKIDIRKYGSGNIGTTNVFRTLGWKFGLAVFLADFCKAFAFVQIVKWFYFQQQPLLLVLAAFLLIVGNVFPVFLRFKGGKGVASSAGIFVGLCPFALLLALVVFFLAVYFTRYVSLGSLLATVTLFVVNLYFYLQGQDSLLVVLILTGAIMVFIWWKHAANIKRILNGTERKLGKKKEKL